jgi:hypothetical protein
MSDLWGLLIILLSPNLDLHPQGIKNPHFSLPLDAVVRVDLLADEVPRRAHLAV